MEVGERQQPVVVDTLLQPKVGDDLVGLHRRWQSFGRAADAHDQVVQAPLVVHVDELAAGLRHPVGQLGLHLVFEAVKVQLFASKKPFTSTSLLLFFPVDILGRSVSISNLGLWFWLLMLLRSLASVLSHELVLELGLFIFNTLFVNSGSS